MPKQDFARQCWEASGQDGYRALWLALWIRSKQGRRAYQQAEREQKRAELLRGKS